MIRRVPVHEGADAHLDRQAQGFIALVRTLIPRLPNLAAIADLLWEISDSGVCALVLAHVMANLNELNESNLNLLRDLYEDAPVSIWVSAVISAVYLSLAFSHVMGALSTIFAFLFGARGLDEQHRFGEWVLERAEEHFRAHVRQAREAAQQIINDFREVGSGFREIWETRHDLTMEDPPSIGSTPISEEYGLSEYKSSDSATAHFQSREADGFVLAEPTTDGETIEG